MTSAVQQSHASRILTVHFALTLGGATQLAIDDAVALRGQGFEVGFASEPGVFEKDLDARAIRLHRLHCVNPERYPRWFRYLVGIPLTTILVLWYVVRYKYDCLYVQHRQSGIPGTVVSWLTGAEYVFIAHAEFGRFNRGRLLTPLGRHVLANSEQIKGNIARYFRVPTERITVIRNAVTTNVVRASEDAVRAFETKWSIPADAVVVACVAVMIDGKGHDVLLAAWREVRRDFPHAVLVLTADGYLRGGLEVLAGQLGIQESVRFVGFVPDLSVVYSRASLVVLASRSEGQSLTLLEAFAYGLPVVATSVGGIPEVVLPGETGLLVEPDDAPGFARAMKRLMGDADLRRRLGQAGRQLVVDRHSTATRAAALGTYFRALTNGG